MPCEKLRLFRQSRDWGGDADWEDTERLKTLIRNHVGSPPKNGLSDTVFDRIVDWKLRRQRGRTEDHRTNLTEDILGSVTKTAFVIRHDEPEYLARVRTDLLRSIPGIGIGVASAILALTFPEEYGVIDFRVWKIIFNEERRSFEMGAYLKYLMWIRSCALHLGWQVQHVDFFTWKYYEVAG